MDNFQDWQLSSSTSGFPSQMTFSNNREFDEYLGGYNEIDNLLTESLSLQDLDLPINVQSSDSTNDYLNQYSGYQLMNKNSNHHQNAHSKKASGTAIFGFGDQKKEFSFPGNNEIYKKSVKHTAEYGSSISPNTLFNQNDNLQRHQSLNNNSEDDNNFIINSKKSNSLKFPVMPEQQQQVQSVNQYSVAYLQEFSRYFQQSNSDSAGSFMNLQETYVDDFEPLLNDNFASANENNFNQGQQDQQQQNYQFQSNDLKIQPKYPQTRYNNQYQYVSIPVQQPSLKQNFCFPPPQPPKLEQFVSPEENYSSPEPPTPGYSEAQYETYNTDVTDHQVPFTNIINSSPIRGVYPNDQLRFDPKTPNKRKKEVELTWSPVVLQKASLGDAKVDHQKIIEQFSPRRKSTEKVSTLPPGAIDTFIDGPDDKKIYTCNFQGCGKRFTRRYNIRSHIQTHLCDRPYCCTHCHKKFVRQHDLHRHEKIHQEFNHTCECGKKFSRHDALKRHQFRNICPGGIVPEGAITKPLKKRGRPKKIVDPLTSDRIAEDIGMLDNKIGESIDVKDEADENDLFDEFQEANFSFTI